MGNRRKLTFIRLIYWSPEYPAVKNYSACNAFQIELPYEVTTSHSSFVYESGACPSQYNNDMEKLRLHMAYAETTAVYISIAKGCMLV